MVGVWRNRQVYPSEFLDSLRTTLKHDSDCEVQEGQLTLSEFRSQPSKALTQYATWFKSAELAHQGQEDIKKLKSLDQYFRETKLSEQTPVDQREEYRCKALEYELAVERHMQMIAVPKLRLYTEINSKLENLYLQELIQLEKIEELLGRLE